MRSMLLRILSLSLAGAIFTPFLAASDIPAGYVSYDVTGLNVAQFDIVNATGPNSSTFPDPTFPIVTSVSLSSLSLVVDYASGGPLTFGSSYFTLASDGLSFNGNPLSTLNGPGSGGLFGALSATLTGVFDTTALTLNDGSTVTVNPGFSATISGSGAGGLLQDADNAVLFATPAGGPPPPVVPEPSTWVLVGTGLLGLAGKARSGGRRLLKSLGQAGSLGTTFAIACVLVLLPVSLSATSVGSSTVKLNYSTVPSSGASGSSTVSVAGTGFPSGTITPADVSVSLATVCGGSPTAAVASYVKHIYGSEDKIEFLIPGSLATGNYYVSVSGFTSTGATFVSGNCSQVQVTHTTTALAACLPSSSLAVLSGKTVTAYVPNGNWSSSATGIQAVFIEGGGSAVSIPTANAVNACSSNSQTGETVCTSNGTDVYTITGTSLTGTLTDGASGTIGFTGGSPSTAGIAINALSNTAVIALSDGGLPAIQLLNLANNTFAKLFDSNTSVSENQSIDPNRNLILSPNEAYFGPSSGTYTLYKLDSTGNVTEYDSTITDTTGYTNLDSAAEDCTTGIALSTSEFTGNLVIADLTQAVFTPPVAPATVGTWTAPNKTVNFPEFDAFSAGTSGISVAAGTTHLGIVTGEFGGNSFGAFQLPATSGSGTPGFVDYVQAYMPNTPDGNSFQSGDDPHTITAYTSPNNGKAYGLMSNGAVSYVGVIDLQALLSATRTAGTHSVDPSVNLIANGIVRYVATH